MEPKPFKLVGEYSDENNYEEPPVKPKIERQRAERVKKQVTYFPQQEKLSDLTLPNSEEDLKE